MLKPFFSFYGGKWRAAPRYPAPRYGSIVEPFAGSAGFSVRWHLGRQVTLIDKDPAVAATWRYLLRASSAEILALPLVPPGSTVDDFRLSDEQKCLIGFWLNKGSSTPRRSLSSWSHARPKSAWGIEIRARIASQVSSIRHWTITEGNYTEAPDDEATWFIDPPYVIAGRHYRHSSSAIDFAALAEWCRDRRGQTLVCENVGANWLPFKPFMNAKASEAKHGGKRSKEALWVGP